MIIVIVIGIVLLILELMELNLFKVTDYQMMDESVPEPITICFLSDLHGHTYGTRLIKQIKKLQPDVILLGGDIVSHRCPNQLEEILPFMKALADITTVYYGFGNHEEALSIFSPEEDEELFYQWEYYLRKIQEYGIKMIRNSSVNLTDSMKLYQMEVPLENYTKRSMVELSERTIEDCLGMTKEEFKEERRKGIFQILMVHQPCYGIKYGTFEPNLVLSGHTHGGLVRFPYIGSIISPELTWFPKFDGGSYDITPTGGKKSRLIVSKGLGTHTYHIRVLNRAELVQIRILPCNRE